MKRKICVITGTRAEYGILYPVLRAIKASSKLQLQLVATGMHLMKEFGYSLKLIKKDGFAVTTVDMSYGKDTQEAMSEAFGKAAQGLTKVLCKLRPDVVVILGDRGEVLAAAIVANYLNIPLAHIHGGEVSGHIDGNFRHAITKLAHVHFPATTKSAERIRKLGEESWRINVSGAPALDRVKSGQVTLKAELTEKYRINPKRKLAVIVLHPMHTEIAQAANQIKMVLKCVMAQDIQVIGIYPNADTGGRAMIKEIHKIKSPSMKFYKNIPHADYLGLLKIADVFIGNSSSGIIETPMFKLPAVNIGGRQHGRESGINVIHVPFNEVAIKAAITKALSVSFKRKVASAKNPYGKGEAAQVIVKCLNRLKLNKHLLEKKITY